jgi:hypothetical protein
MMAQTNAMIIKKNLTMEVTKKEEQEEDAEGEEQEEGAGGEEQEEGAGGEEQEEDSVGEEQEECAVGSYILVDINDLIYCGLVVSKSAENKATIRFHKSLGKKKQKNDLDEESGNHSLGQR